MDGTLHDGDLVALEAAWRELHAGQPGATPFMSAEWALAWWPHYAVDAEPFVVVVRDGDAIVGLAPFVRRRRGPLRVLEPIGMEPGDYWDILAAPGRQAEVAAVAVETLRAERSSWDAWILRCLPPESPVVGALEQAKLPAVVRPAIAAPAVDLTAGFDAYLASLSGSRRQNLRKHLRRLDNEVELLDITDQSALPEAIARWQRFREAQWEATDKTINPEHLSERFAAFILDCLRTMIPAGLAHLWEFRVEGRTVGAYVNFVDAKAFFWYLGGFDPEVQRLGLGKIAIGHGMQTSAELGRERFDFGRGAEPYKYWYGAEDRPLAARVVLSGTVRARAAGLAARSAIAIRSRTARD